MWNHRSQAGIGKAAVAMGEGDGFGPAAWVRAAVVVGRLAEQRAGRSSSRPDEQEVRRRASRRLGRTVVGDDPGLRVLLADLAQAPLTPLGRVWLRNELIRREVTEARLREEVHRRPGLLDTPLPRPLVVVVGLPRTGTTLLHTLLGCDPAAVVLPFWRLRRPYPVPRRRLDRVTRIMRAAAMARLARSMAPRLADIHPVSALRPEEDVFLFRDTGMLAVPVTAPGYLRWLQAADPTPGYQTYRRHLQALLQDRPGRRPVLKSPFHLGRLATLLAEVPEAVVVWTQRDPAVALASWCSLAAVLGNAASDQVDLGALGRRWLEFWATELDRALAARTATDPAHFHDVGYQALVADPLGEVERVYAPARPGAVGRRPAADAPLDPPPSPPRPRPPPPVLPGRLRAGADFGLDPAVVDRRFAPYRQWVATVAGS